MKSATGTTSQQDRTVTAATLSNNGSGWAVVVNFTNGKKQRRSFDRQIDAEMFYMSMCSRMI